MVTDQSVPDPVDDSGDQMGPFYELESSSPALALQPGGSATHTQTIIHLYGEEADLQQVLSAVAPGVELSKVRAALQEKRFVVPPSGGLD